MIAIGNRICHTGVVGVSLVASHAVARANTRKPGPAIIRGCALSTRPSDDGARMPVTIAIGAINSAERVGDSPVTLCA